MGIPEVVGNVRLHFLILGEPHTCVAEYAYIWYDIGNRSVATHGREDVSAIASSGTSASFLLLPQSIPAKTKLDNQTKVLLTADVGSADTPHGKIVARHYHLKAFPHDA